MDFYWIVCLNSRSFGFIRFVFLYTLDYIMTWRQEMTDRICPKCKEDYRGCLSPECPIPLDKRVPVSNKDRDW